MFKKLSLLTVELLLSVSVFANDVQDLIQKAENGDMQAQFILGAMYEEGEVVPQDYAKALEWYTKSANQGDTDAQNNLGVMYAVGNGVPQDDEIAKKWFDRACEGGNKGGCTNIKNWYTKPTNQKGKDLE